MSSLVTAATRPKHGGNRNWAAAIARCSPDQLLDFSASINPLGPPDSAIAAIQDQLATLQTYPDPNYPELKSVLAEFHGIEPDWILPGNGAAELLTWAGYELAQLDAVVLPTPAFGDYRRSLQTFGARIIEQPLDLDRMIAGQPILPMDQALLSIDSDRCGVVINNPHNPTGKLWSMTDLLPYVEAMGLVVVDEAFMDFVPNPEPHSLIERVADYPNLVVVRSLTKFYSLPGIRLGYAIAHPDRVRQWQAWRDPWAVNTLAEAAGMAVLQDMAFQQQTLQWLPSARQQLWDGFSQLSPFQVFPAAANYLLVNTKQSSVQLQQQLLEADRILIRDCLSFPELGDRFFRVAVRQPTDNQRLLDAMQRVVTTPDGN
jgi:L-threonine-O-3-phosphate decarboxylase